MSSQYASRFKILPLDLRGNELWIGTSEPFDLAWMQEFGNATRKQIQPVMVNPAGAEPLYRRVLHIGAVGQGRPTERPMHGQRAQNFEQLVEMGKSGKEF